MKITLAALVAALAAAPAAAATAQDAPQAKAVGTYTPKKCEGPGWELETVYQLTLKKGAQPVILVYSGCRDEDRDDLVAGYTERDFQGDDGYGMALITGHGDGAYNNPSESPKVSHVLIAKGKTWIADFGDIENAKITSQGEIAKGEMTLQAVNHAIPSVPKCDADVQSPYGRTDLWLLTKKKAYYYVESCDICEEIDSCDLQTGKIKVEVAAHQVSCGEISRFTAGEEIVYQSCDR